MIETPPADRRFLPLESLRGLAALQVLLLHLFTAFVPAIILQTGEGVGGVIARSPLFYAYDGYSAVYTFFAISGFVLAAPFARDAARPVRVIVARWLRLGVPAVAACLFAALIIAIWPLEHVAAGKAIGSAWLSNLWRPAPGLAALAYDSVINALFLGYREDGAIASLDIHEPWQQSITAAYVVPLWTISVEFFGSLLILAMVEMRRFGGMVWPLGLGLIIILFARTPYICFVIGFVAAIRGWAANPGRVPAAACLAGVAVGIMLCVTAGYHVWSPLAATCNVLLPIGSCGEDLHFQKRVGSVLIFLSVIQWAWALRVLSSASLAWAGKLSFPVYLVHWPIIFGLCCAVYLAVTPAVGGPSASAIAVLLGFAVTMIAGFTFTYVDGAAVAVSRRVRPRSVSEIAPGSAEA